MVDVLLDGVGEFAFTGPVVTERKRELPSESEVPFLATEWIKQPDDVAPLALFLATQPDGSGSTGQSFSLTRRRCGGKRPISRSWPTRSSRKCRSKRGSKARGWFAVSTPER